MSKLNQGDPLKVHLGAPKKDVLIMHPEEGRKIDILTQQEELNLFLDQDAFVDNGEPHDQITLFQKNALDKGALQMKYTLKKVLGNPNEVKVFRKMNNVLLIPL